MSLGNTWVFVTKLCYKKADGPEVCFTCPDVWIVSQHRCVVTHVMLTDMLLIDKVLIDKVMIFVLHYCDVTWASRKLKPSATWLFVGQHVQTDNISIIKAVHYLLFVWLVHSFHKGQVIWKAFSCHDIIMVICHPWVSHQGIYMLNAIFADLQVCSEIRVDKEQNNCEQEYIWNFFYIREN